LKIDQPGPSAQPLNRQGKAASAPTSGADTAAARVVNDAGQASGQVHILPSAPGGADFDAARVAAIREDIRAGRYKINPERIASGLLDSVRDLLDTKK